MRKRCDPLTNEQRDLVERNRWLAVNFAGQRVPSGPRGAQDFSEVLSAAYLGLCYAARGFDPGRGYAFSTFAWFWMRSVCNASKLENHIVRIASLGRRRSPQVEEAMQEFLRMKRVGFYTREKGDQVGNHDLVLARRLKRLQDEQENRVQKLQPVLRELDRLEPRRQEIVRRNVMQREPVAAIARDLGISRERARQLRQEGLLMLRRRLEAIDYS